MHAFWHPWTLGNLVVLGFALCIGDNFLVVWKVLNLNLSLVLCASKSNIFHIFFSIELGLEEKLFQEWGIGMHIVSIANIFKPIIVWCDLWICFFHCYFERKNNTLVELFLDFWVEFFGIIWKEWKKLHLVEHIWNILHCICECPRSVGSVSCTFVWH